MNKTEIKPLTPGSVLPSQAEVDALKFPRRTFLAVGLAAAVGCRKQAASVPGTESSTTSTNRDDTLETCSQAPRITQLEKAKVVLEALPKDLATYRQRVTCESPKRVMLLVQFEHSSGDTLAADDSHPLNIEVLANKDQMLKIVSHLTDGIGVKGVHADAMTPTFLNEMKEEKDFLEIADEMIERRPQFLFTRNVLRERLKFAAGDEKNSIQRDLDVLDRTIEFSATIPKMKADILKSIRYSVVKQIYFDGELTIYPTEREELVMSDLALNKKKISEHLRKKLLGKDVSEQALQIIMDGELDIAFEDPELQSSIEEREDKSLPVMLARGEEAILALMGGLHNYTNNVEAWNEANPEDGIILYEIRPTELSKSFLKHLEMGVIKSVDRDL